MFKHFIITKVFIFVFQSIMNTTMADNHLADVPTISSSSPLMLSPSTPLPLSGFINGDTIHVNGDTGNLQFSLQFNIRNTPLNQNSLYSSASSYVTPATTHENEDQDVNLDALCHESVWAPLNDEGPEKKKTDTIMTRLRTGVLSPISYRPLRFGALKHSVGSWRRRRGKKRNRETRNVLETILRRRSRPVRPCSSYSLFVMASWGRVKCCSFGATSKRLGDMWCNLSHDQKKVFEDLALKDNARYKRQCILLKDHVHEVTNSGSLANSEH